MEIWGWISILLIILMLVSRKQQKNRLKQRLIRNERLLQMIAYYELTIDPELGTEREIDMDFFELVQQDKTMNAITRAEIDMIKLIQQGKKIEAIKRAREIYHFGLKEAKDHVDELEHKMNNV